MATLKTKTYHQKKYKTPNNCSNDKQMTIIMNDKNNYNYNYSCSCSYSHNLSSNKIVLFKSYSKLPPRRTLNNSGTVQDKSTKIKLSRHRLKNLPHHHEQHLNIPLLNLMYVSHQIHIHIYMLLSI